MKQLSEKLNSAIRIFAQSKEAIAAVYVFGSFAVGKNRKTSDLDIAVMTCRNIQGWERIEWETELSRILKIDADLTIFHQASPLLQHQILKHGRLIVEKYGKERIRQEVFARFAYLDTEFLYKEMRSK